MTRAASVYYAEGVQDGPDWVGVLCDLLSFATLSFAGTSTTPRRRVEIRRLAPGSEVVATVARRRRQGRAEDDLMRVRADLMDLTVAEFLAAYEIDDETVDA